MARATEKTEPRSAATSSWGDGVPRSGSIAVCVRAAVPQDREPLARLRRQAEAVHARLLPDYFRESLLSDAREAPPATGSAILVAERVDAPRDVLGYVSVNLVDTPRDPAMTPRRRVHVDTVVVEDKVRGSGIGTALMRAAADWARRREAAELVLTVWSDNQAAEALYRRAGFRPIARILRLPIDG